MNHVIGGGALNRVDGFLYSASAVSLKVITVIRKKAIYQSTMTTVLLGRIVLSI